MGDYEDPLDLLDDDGDGIIEMCLLEEEGKLKKDKGHKNSGCCIFFLIFASSALISIWGIAQFI